MQFRKLCKPDSSKQAKDIATKNGFNCLAIGSVLLMAGTAHADHGLPVPLNPVLPNLTVPQLSVPTLHPGVAVGQASATYSADGHQLTINQSTENAILDWNSFNIAAGNSVQFVQPNSSAIALNNINQSNASQIFGSLSANGQVYLVNNNGFVFGPNAAVNTNSLVATSLNITDTVIQQGITNVVDQNLNAENTPNPALVVNSVTYLHPATQENIQILIEPGAVINAADGGRVLLAAPNVINQGAISAPDGQVLLVAATDKVYLQEYTSSDMRGLMVEVQTGGSVQNLGTILTARGNTTLMGFAVTQGGVVSASTSVVLNGSVKLLANEGAQLQTNSNTTITTSSQTILEPLSTTRSTDIGDGLGTIATVTLASGSKTSVNLDDSGGTAVNGQAQPQSLVEAAAGKIVMQGATASLAGAQIVAHGGVVDMIAATDTSTLSNINTAAVDYAQFISAMTSTSANDLSRILLENGSDIDVSGAQNVSLPMSDNVVSLTLYSNELRDDPVQKNGILYGQTVSVDTRLGTALADISGATANQQYSVEYRNSNAGTINLTSKGDVIVQQGANLNISGGSLDYQAGTIETTDLMSNGAIFSLFNASPNLLYQQIFNISSYQPGYTQGRNAGTINIYSRDLLLDGDIQAQTVNGPYQRSAADLAGGGQLNINTAWSSLAQQDVIFQNAQTFTALPPPGMISSPLYLSNALFSQGLSSLNLDSGGNLTIDQGVALTLPELGGLNLQAGSITMLGRISAPGGTVNLTTQVGLDATQATSGAIQLSANSIIDVSGVWVNDLQDTLSSQTLKPLAINAGGVSLQAQGDLLLDQGSQLLANGGAWLQNNLQLTAGTGGNINLSSAGLNVETQLLLGAQLSAYALSEGGKLSITANAIDIGAVSDLQNPDADTLYLPNSALESGGFSAYTLTANSGNLSVGVGASAALPQNLILMQSNWQLTAGAYTAGSGAPLSSLTTPVVLAANIRNPVNLSLNIAHNPGIGGYVADSTLSVAQYTTISADPNATLTLDSDANITIDGQINAPSGTIGLTISGPSSAIDPGYNPNQAITLAAAAVLNAAGAVIATPNTAGFSLADVENGGTISLTANRGYILAAACSKINVSGNATDVDIANAQGINLETIASNAGTINLTAAEGMVLEGTFQAQAGSGTTAAGNGSAAAGGSLNLTLSAQNRGGALGDSAAGGSTFPLTDRVIQVSSTTADFPELTQVFRGVIPASVNGQAYISAAQIQQAGFDNLKLAVLVNATVVAETAAQTQPDGGEIIFTGNVDLALKLSLELDAPLIGSSSGNSQVVLDSDMFTLGSSLNQTPLGSLSNPLTADYATTTSVLTVNANLIDLRGAGLISGFAQTVLNSSGDIRLQGVNPNGEQNLIGSLSLTGEMDLSAQEIYPTTMSQFSISIDTNLSPNGLVNIETAKAAPYTPLSADGSVSISAANIVSAGNLLAPFGTINLQATNALTLAPGSLTSVSAQDNITIPWGQTQGSGLDWYFPLGSYDNIQTGAPQKAITLSAPAIDLQLGSAVNLNGGGDLLAYEFIPGNGGSYDYLAPGSASYQQSFAILPSLSSGFAPYDPLATPNDGLYLGESIHLTGVAGLAAGNYVVLPARYALLPGAYLLTPEPGTANMAAGTTSILADGENVAAGYLFTAGSNVSAANWSGFIVQNGAAAQNYAQYQLSTANQYFQSQATAGTIPSLPQDAGNLSLLANQTLNLAGNIFATAANGGLGGLLDISADNINVVNGSANTAIAGSDTVILSANQLNALGVDSILLGGRRTRSSSGTELTVTAQAIDVATGAKLQAPEILLAATDSITLETGSAISAVGALSRSDTLLTINNAGSSSTDGALIRVSNAAQATVARSNADGQTGTLTIASGATLSSSNSMLLDTSKSGTMQGDITMSQGQLTLSAGLITLGGVANANAGLQLSDAILNNLNVANLTLNSTGSITIADAITLGLSNLTLDAAGIIGTIGNKQTASISADSITLQNSSSATATGQATDGQGVLQLQAGAIILGPGVYNWSGFKQINLLATQALTDSGTSNVNVNGNLNITTPVWTALSGANATVTLSANNTLTTFADGAAATQTGLGGQLSLAAANIVAQGRIQMASGLVSLDAGQNLTLASSAEIDTSGQIILLGNQQSYASGGTINLSSAAGNIDIQSGAVLNVSGSGLGGNAGSLSLLAGQGMLSLDGATDGDFLGAGYQGASGGNFTLDAQQIVLGGINGLASGGFSVLNQLMAQGGFIGNQAIRLGQGNILVAGADTDTAGNISLTADNGLVTVLGALNVSGGQAGAIQLAGNNGVLIESGSSLQAVSGAAGNQGGSIVLTSDPVSGSGQGVLIADSSDINVFGAAGGGTVQAVVNRVSANDAAINISGNGVQGASSLTVAAMAHYLNIPLSNAQIQQWNTATQNYLLAADQNSPLQTRLGGFSLQPGLDIISTTSLTLNLTESIAGIALTPVANSKSVYMTQLNNVAGAVTGLQEINSKGVVVKTFTAATSSNLTAGTYYFDSDPASPTFRDLFIYPVSSKDTFVESNGWDLALPYISGGQVLPVQTVGLLSLRTTGNATINQNLSDGFVTYDSNSINALLNITSGASWQPTLVLQSGPSWSFDIIAGADLSSANPLDVQTSLQAGTLTIGSNSSIRTGSGALYLAAAGNIALTDWTSTVYTAGQAAANNQFGSFGTSTANFNNQMIASDFFVQYPDAGGNVTLKAGGNIIGAVTPQLMSGWLQRTGDFNSSEALSSDNLPTAWGIAFDGLVSQYGTNSTTSLSAKNGFRENIGALGGGNVSIQAGANIINLSVMLPTTAKPMGAIAANGDMSQNIWQQQGGGNLAVSAGGNIEGGVFYVDQGSAKLSAVGAITGQTAAGPTIWIPVPQADLSGSTASHPAAP